MEIADIQIEIGVLERFEKFNAEKLGIYFADDLGLRPIEIIDWIKIDDFADFKLRFHWNVLSTIGLIIAYLALIVIKY